MKTDRELLELAARAAGIEIDWDSRGAFVVIPGVSGGDKTWNPLTDDGDALRLAVKLTLELDVCMTGIAVRTPCGHKALVDADEVPDAYAATRRAIVRAAAAIGEAM